MGRIVVTDYIHHLVGALHLHVYQSSSEPAKGLFGATTTTKRFELAEARTVGDVHLLAYARGVKSRVGGAAGRSSPPVRASRRTRRSGVSGHPGFVPSRGDRGSRTGSGWSGSRTSQGRAAQLRALRRGQPELRSRQALHRPSPTTRRPGLARWRPAQKAASFPPRSGARPSGRCASTKRSARVAA